MGGSSPSRTRASLEGSTCKTSFSGTQLSLRCREACLSSTCTSVQRGTLLVYVIKAIFATPVSMSVSMLTARLQCQGQGRTTGQNWRHPVRERRRGLLPQGPPPRTNAQVSETGAHSHQERPNGVPLKAGRGNSREMEKASVWSTRPCRGLLHFAQRLSSLPYQVLDH